MQNCKALANTTDGVAETGIPSRVTKASLAIVKRVARTQLVPGAVIWAHIPYEDGQGEKTRPAVVVDRSGRDVTVLPATTSGRRWDFPDKYAEVQDLVAAGLTRPTGIRMSAVEIDVIEIIDFVGHLGVKDRNALPQLSHAGSICESARSERIVLIKAMATAHWHLGDAA